MNRRQTLLGCLALLPAGVLLPATVPLSAGAPPVFRPQAGSYRLARRVSRQLGAGATLMVERAWTIELTSQEGGFLVAGRQAGVTVDAPPSLAFLAQLEQDRIEEGMFPIMLDQTGVMAFAPAGQADEVVAQAVDQVRQLLTVDRARDTAGKEQGNRFLDTLQQAGQAALAAWPPTLFAPGTQDHTDERTVDLPDGTLGVVRVRTVALSDPRTGLLERFERQVETRFGGDRRVGVEAFFLSPGT